MTCAEAMEAVEMAGWSVTAIDDGAFYALPTGPGSGGPSLYVRMTIAGPVPTLTYVRSDGTPERITVGGTLLVDVAGLVAVLRAQVEWAA